MVKAGLVAGGVALVATIGVLAQRPDAVQAPLTHPAIAYATAPLRDPITQLNERLESGAARLAFDQKSGYLSAVLAALNVPVESQTLVFSHTSLQADQIAFKTPRALYFNDRVAVGWVKGSDLLELTAHDPVEGVVFYTLTQQTSNRPRFTRETSECLLCHASWDTFAVPGLLTMSTFPMPDNPNAFANGVPVDHRVPFFQRWGGWYVTAKSESLPHLGNLPVVRPAADLAKPAPPTPHLQSVTGQFDTSAYLTPYSDIVALMVLNHQTNMTNLLTRIGWEARVAANDRAPLDRVRAAATDLVDYMLFVDEAPLGRRIEGSSGFAETFAKQGPSDASGRSLRQFDLQSRVFRFPCSYMIYSDAFDALPASALDAIYRRLWTVLSGQAAASDKKYARLTLADRRAIVEILLSTKKNLPSYFTPVLR